MKILNIAVHLLSILSITFCTPFEKSVIDDILPFKDEFDFNLLERHPELPKQSHNNGDPGEALMLSEYLEKNDTETARKLSIVDLKQWSSDVVSHAGYITVDKNYNSNLYFWYFPVQNQTVEKSPLVIWLQGGPGTSSLYGLFEEIGPFSVDENASILIDNPYSWHKENSLLFIDNPVGTGFSFTGGGGYAQNQTIIADHLYKCLIQFLRIFPELQDVPLFITGESYAGKYVPSFAHYIHKKNPTADLKVNLKGIAIGNGIIDPETMLHFSDNLYQLGLVDDNQKKIIEDYESMTKIELQKKNYTKAVEYFEKIRMILNSQVENEFNYIDEKESNTNGPYSIFIQRSDVKKALHVGSAEFATGGPVYDNLSNDVIKSVKTDVEELLEHYRVMLYSGQLDLVVAYALSVQTYRSFNWSGASQYLKADRMPWYNNNTIIGYTRKVGNFLEVFVRNSGHMLPKDQPQRAYLLINSFIKDLPLRNTTEESIDT